MGQGSGLCSAPVTLADVARSQDTGDPSLRVPARRMMRLHSMWKTCHDRP